MRLFRRNLKFGFLVILVLLPLMSFYANSQQLPEKKYKKVPWSNRPLGCFPPKQAKMVETCVLDYQETRGSINGAFMIEDVQRILKAEEIVAYSTDRLRSGEYLFEAWFDAMQASFEFIQGGHDQLIEEWIKAQNGQGYSLMAKALGQYGKGVINFNYQDFRYNSPGTLVIYAKKLMQANATLDSVSPKLKKTAPWYEMKLKIAYQLPKLRPTTEKLFKEAVNAWPDYAPIYSVAYAFSHPKWGGTYEAMDEIIRLALHNTKDRIGTVMYPMVVLGARIHDRAFEATDRMDWEMMKQGFRDYEQYLGGRPLLYHYFASVACRMRDRAEARWLYGMFDKLLNKTINRPDSCREFAFSQS